MKTKNIIINVLIFAAGAAAGYFGGVNHVKAMYRQDAIDNREFYLTKLQEAGLMPEDFEPPVEAVEGDEDDKEAFDARYAEEAKKYAAGVLAGVGGKGRPITKYNKPPLSVVAYGELEPEPGDDPDDTEPEPDEDYEAELDARAEELAERMAQNQAQGLPYVIDHGDYLDSPQEYDRIALYYYATDRVLCEDDDTKVDVDDEEETVGLDYEDILDMQTSVWVRNDKLMNLYEIHRMDDAYYSAVANLNETPTERDFRIKGRRKSVLDR